MKEFFLDGPDEYKLMPQYGVKQYCYPMDCTHNAIWDCNLSPEGKFYYSLSTELVTCGYTRLCEYDYENNEAILHFKAEDVILPSDRTIRASKFHASINFLPDGKLIMATHTTDKPANHPTWMPNAYFNHVWEGYPGSNIIIYDPVAHKAENMGIPAPRETIYGAVYEPKHNALFFSGCFKGHLYRYSLDDKRVIDLGKVSECYSFRLVLGPDGHIYGSSASGYMYKIDTGTLKIQDMNYRLPHNSKKYAKDYNDLCTGHIGPDGRLYLSVMYGDDMIALDTKKSSFENMGRYVPARYYVRGENRDTVYAKAFDSKGLLWYIVSALNDSGAQLKYGLPASLFRWDITRGGDPEWMGVFGTKSRTAGCVSGLEISGNDILYAVNTNHSTDGPDITAVDLNILKQHTSEFGGDTEDDYFNPHSAFYRQRAEKEKALEEIGKRNPNYFAGKLAYSPIRLWRELAPDNLDNSGVTGLAWADDGSLHGRCGRDGSFVFQIAGGKVKNMMPSSDADSGYIRWLAANIEPKLSTLQADSPLPAYPGRQYKAVSRIDAEFSGGRRIVGTEDGMLAIISENGMFSLGPAAPNGPIRAMATNPAKTVLYGVAGDDEDLGSIFTYDDINGLIWRGSASYNSSDYIGIVSLNQLSCCSISRDGKYLSIASCDRLGTVLIYAL